MLGAAPAVVDQRRASTSYVFGDIHGCASSLASALDAVRADQSWHGRGRSGLRASPAMIFNGDFVDRGESSVEVLSSLLLLRHVDPRNVVLLRGNHEDELLSTAYGFRDELTEKYGVQGSARLWSHMSRLFAALPLGARIGADGFVVHGGVHDAALRIDDIDAALPPDVRARHEKGGYDDDEYCSREWCTSEGEEDWDDCWAGTPGERCTCARGEARLTGETYEDDGTTHCEYRRRAPCPLAASRFA